MSGFSGAISPGLTKSDVINNLTSTATDKPLSAAQGKALSEAIAQSTAFSPDYANAVLVSYTASNQQYIAPNNGYIKLVVGNITTGIQVKISNHVVFYDSPSYYGLSKIAVHWLLPVAKDDDVRIIYDNATISSTQTLYFIPLKRA